MKSSSCQARQTAQVLRTKAEQRPMRYVDRPSQRRQEGREAQSPTTSRELAGRRNADGSTERVTGECAMDMAGQ